MDLPIGLEIKDKFRLLRKRESLSQQQLCDLTGVPQSTYSHIESGRNKTIGVDVLSKIVSHPRFFPYAMWLLVDELTEDQAQETLSFLRALKESEK